MSGPRMIFVCRWVDGRQRGPSTDAGGTSTVHLGTGSGKTAAMVAWHARMARWAAGGEGHVAAEYDRVVVDADARHADALLAGLVDAVLEADDGDHVAVGVAGGRLDELPLADGRLGHAGTAVEEARVAAVAAVPGLPLVTGGARAMLGDRWRYGRRSVLRGPAGSVACHELLWHEGLRPSGSRWRRLRGTVAQIQRRRGDTTMTIIGDDGTAYWAQAHEQLTPDPAAIAHTVWFVAPTGTTEDRPRAVAMVGVGSRATGTVERAGERVFLRAEAPSGHHLSFAVDPDDPTAAHAAAGDRFTFTVGDGQHGPTARDLRPVAGAPAVTVLERLLVGCVEELAAHGGSGAAAAVRRSTKNIRTDADPAAEQQRLWLLLDHAAHHWAAAALRSAGQGDRADDVDALRPIKDARGAWTLDELLAAAPTGGSRLRGGEDPKRVLDATRIAARHAARTEAAPASDMDVDHAARAATAAGQAMAQALLCGVIDAVPSEAKHLARRLAAVPPSAPAASATGGPAEPQEPRIDEAFATQALRALVEHAERDVMPRLGDAPGDVWDRLLPITFFTRAVSCASAGLLLAQGGFARELWMLNRPLFELVVDAHWAASDPQRANDRLVGHVRLTYHQQARLMERFPELTADPATRQRLPAAEADRLRKQYGNRGWTGLTMPDRIEQLAQRFPDVAGLMREVNAIGNKLANEEVHSASNSLRRTLRRVTAHDGSERLQVRTGPEAELVFSGLQHAWWALFTVTELVYTTCEWPRAPLHALHDMWGRLLEVVVPEP